MRVVIQRVSNASVSVEKTIISHIEKGLLILVGIEDTDNDTDIKYLTNKICNLRIFDDNNGVMNNSILNINGEILLVSQFTLHASTAKGNRPSYIKASKSNFAEPMYQSLCKNIETYIQKPISKGSFGANMKINLTNDGPVTIIIDSKERNF